jgi:pilus assembly protein CpaB
VEHKAGLAAAGRAHLGHLAPALAELVDDDAGEFLVDVDDGFLDRLQTLADRIPAKFRPATALTSLDSINGKVALSTLSPNTVIVEGQFVEPRAAQVTFSQRIPAGNVAVTVSVDQVRGVAGLLVPGDKVNILVADGASQRVLYQNVPIIAIGSTAAPQPGETSEVQNPGSGLITFAVPPDAASRIAFAASQGGGLYLTLVPQDNQAVDIPPINTGNLFPSNREP